MKKDRRKEENEKISRKCEEKENQGHESTIILFLQKGIFLVTVVGLSLLQERHSTVKS